jgi:hypothetical protein
MFCEQMVCRFIAPIVAAGNDSPKCGKKLVLELQYVKASVERRVADLQ